MKIAVSGKGGVGKTTLSAALAATLSLEGHVVIALDADPDSNLASALGVGEDNQPTPIAEMHDLIEQRTGAKDGYGGYFKLNPKVDDIPEDYSCRIANIRLLAIGGVSTGGGGCICPASALVKALLTHLVLGRDDDVVMDMEAGIEHLGRATAQSMDALLIVVDNGPWSLQTAARVKKLAADIALKNIFAVANRVTDQTDIEHIRGKLGGVPLVGRIPFDERLAQGVMRRDNGGFGPTRALTDLLAVLRDLVSEIRTRVQQPPANQPNL